jgi:hypothetical protein
MQMEVPGTSSFCGEIQYSHMGGAGEAVCRGEPTEWFGISKFELEASTTGMQHELIWPDIGAHAHWRAIATARGDSQLAVRKLLVWEYQTRLDVHEAFVMPAPTEIASFAQNMRPLIESGDLVLGNNSMLPQLHHEGDLLGWGASIQGRPAFMTLYAKAQTSRDFAGLIHRFRRVRAPLLVLSGTSVAAREKLRRLLKPLLKPEFASSVSGLDDPDEIISALCRSQQTTAGGGGAPPPS